jgi:hypothetical protein
MSQGNWGGGGGPGGWGPPGGGGYGPPGGAPPGGGGYGPPGGAPPPGGGYGPPGGAPPPGGYGPPGGAPPPGGYGPPGGAPPPGGYGPPGGAPPPGGYGPPPGGGGYGPPPGAGGYGPPPGAGGYGPPPGAGGPIGARAQFTGDGGKLLVTYLLYGVAPMVVGGIIFGIFAGIGAALENQRHPTGVGAVFALIGSLLFAVVAVVGGLMVTSKIFEFRYANMVLDGQQCRYLGTPGGLLKAMIVPTILTSITGGIYAPWMICNLWTWLAENTEVNGQRGRLTFHGEGGTLLGKFIVGYILIYCTLGIYGPWFANDVFAFHWENTKLDGRSFGFRKDPGGFFGTYLLNMILIYCTSGIYTPWAVANITKWECERVS